jgi:hypothetical protein
MERHLRCGALRTRSRAPEPAPPRRLHSGHALNLSRRHPAKTRNRSGRLPPRRSTQRGAPRPIRRCHIKASHWERHQQTGEPGHNDTTHRHLTPVNRCRCRAAWSLHVHAFPYLRLVPTPQSRGHRIEGACRNVVMTPRVPALCAVSRFELDALAASSCPANPLRSMRDCNQTTERAPGAGSRPCRP